jgi:hypothetical protein
VTSDFTASITLSWNPILVTGGVPITGFMLYSVDQDDVTTLQLDATDQPEVLIFTIEGLALD